jgi:gluconolactonase
MEIVTDGLKFPEGPIALPDGSVVLTEIAAGRITRVAPDGRKAVIAEVGGGPNGLALGPDGKLYCVNNGGFEWLQVEGLLAPGGIASDYSGGRVERIDLDTGKVETLYKSGDFGCVLRGLNDIVFDAHGGFWFTDHGKIDYASRCHDVVGVFYAKADGSFLEEVIFPSNNPNGIGLSPDGATLYVAETYTCRLVRFDVVSPGKVDVTPRLGGLGVPFYHPGGWKHFDSLAVEAGGNICVATLGESGISVASPAGELVEFVGTDDPLTTNICFGGEDMMDTWICLSGTGRLAKTRWRRPGLKLVY